MSYERRLLIESAAGVIARHRPPQEEDASWSAPLWDALQEHGFTRVSLPEELGGTGGDLADAAAVARLIGQTAAPVPLADTVLVGGWLLAEAGLPVGDGPCPAAPSTDGARLERRPGGWRLTGSLPRVPWGRFAETVAVLAATPDGWAVVAVDAADLTAAEAVNLAGEPRDDLMVDAEIDAARVALAPPHVDAAALRRRGALARALTIAGSLDQVLALTVAYVREREQFGRPIAKFQAVQQQIAVLAGEVASASAAVDAAVLAEARGAAPWPVAVAKAEASGAAGRAAAIAHQLHGAMGFTDEYALHHLTRRLWAWRDEFGDESEWWIALGREAAAAGPERLWHVVSGGAVSPAA
ncbi:MAG: putative Acyl-CoA dehydrogenase [Conexibacter sp.]|nr:putative Acyl-CoA dehydrogenase [Conexibacter sp.]MDX6730541.1 acyl-CoA dehydrogenase [Baekduia sp.]